MARTKPRPWLYLGVEFVEVNGNRIDGTYRTVNFIQPGAVGSADPVNGRYQVDLTGGAAGAGTGIPGMSARGGGGWGASIVDLATTGNHALSGGGSIDGVALLDGDYVVAWQQSVASQNGIYQVDTAGAWSRATEYDEDGEIFPGQLIYVMTGAEYGDSLFSVKSDVAITIDTDPIVIGPLQPYIQGNLDLNGGDLVDVGDIVIGAPSGDPTAVIDLSSVNNAGILISSLTTVERDAIASPPNGLLIWNETTNQFEYWNGSSWVAITATGSGGSGAAVVRAAASGNSPLSGPVVSDGVTLNTGDQFLLWQQTDPTENGIWTVDTGGAWSRTAPYDTGTGLFGGLLIYVNEGAIYADSLFSCRNDSAITVGVTDVSISPLRALDGWVPNEIQLVQACTTSNHSLSGLAAVDNVVISEGSVVLVAFQSSGSENGVYLASSGSWSRHPFYTSGGQLYPGKIFFVNSGLKYSNTLFAVNTDAVVDLGVDALIIRPIQPEIAENLDFRGFDARNIGVLAIGTDTPDASAAVDIVSSTKGIAFPSLTTASRDAIGSPKTGLVIYNDTTDSIDYYDGSVWQQIGAGSGTFLGLSDVNDSSYSGKNNFVPRVFAGSQLVLSPTFGMNVDTTERDALDTGTFGAGLLVWNSDTTQLEVYDGTSWVAVDSGGGDGTTFIGLSDTPADYSGDANKLLGVDSGETDVEFKANTFLHNNSSLIVDNSTNIAIGQSDPLKHSTATLAGCTALGYNAGGAAVDLADCTFLGYNAGGSHTESNYNIGVGSNANRGAASTTNYNNTAVGSYSMANQGVGFVSNTAVGSWSLNGAAGSTAQSNVAIGSGSGFPIESGTHNVFVGNNSGGAVTTAQQNVFIGSSTGSTSTTGFGNVLLGYNRDTPAAGTNNYLDIGGTIFGDLQDDRIRIGGGSGVPAFEATLHLDATDGAFLPNRLTTTQRNALVAVEGMLLWNTSNDRFEYYDGSQWLGISAGGTFLDLDDTPSSYASVGRYVPRVNLAENALEWSVTFGTPLTTAERNALSAAEGMLIFNSSTSEMEGYNEGDWRQGGIASGLTFSDQNATIEVEEVTSSSVVGKDLVVQAQSATGSNSDGGDIYVRGGTGGTGGDYGNTYVGQQISVSIKVDDDAIGFFGATPISRPGVTGATVEAAVASALTALANLGLVADNTTF